MAIESHITLRGYFENLPEGSRNIALTEIINTNAPATIERVHLETGNNSFATPINAIGCIIIFDTTSTVYKFIKGIVGDTGINIHPTKPVVLSFPGDDSYPFIINTSGDDVLGAVDLYTEIVYF